MKLSLYEIDDDVVQIHQFLGGGIETGPLQYQAPGRPPTSDLTQSDRLPLSSMFQIPGPWLPLWTGPESTSRPVGKLNKAVPDDAQALWALQTSARLKVRMFSEPVQ
jgi:hypothetical protein